MDASDLGEFGLLGRVREWLGHPSSLLDDAAVLPHRDGTSLVATTDVLVEGTHFRLDWSSPADAGFKAVSVNVSDIAAMGAEPRWLLIGLGCPPETQESQLKDVYSGMAEACALYGTAIVGGDTVRADRITLAVTALGELDGPPLTRAGAKAGDLLAVTGPLGRAAAGVNLLLSQNPRGATPEDAGACIDAHRRPRARVAEGRQLRAAGAHAVMDISDGLASDVRRMAEASGVGIEIDADILPIADEVLRISERRGWDALRVALAGGEDYELLAAVEEAGGLLPVGRVVQEGLWLVRGGGREPLPDAGWDHFGHIP